MNWSSPISLAYELLQSPALPSRLGSKTTLGSSSMPTVLALSICSFCKMDLRYWHWEIITEQSLNVISIPTILTSSPKLVNSHSASRPAFVHSINSSVVANNNRSSIQIVTIMKLLPSYKIYVHRSNIRAQKPRHRIAWSNSIFQTWCNAPSGAGWSNVDMWGIPRQLARFRDYG